MNRVHETRHSNDIHEIYIRHDYFKNSFFPSTIFDRNKLDWKIGNSESLSIFKKNLLNFIQLVQMTFSWNQTANKIPPRYQPPSGK